MTDRKDWGYVRVSQESDASIDQQKQDIREYARDRGLNLVTTRNDGRKTSGFDNDRSEYQILKRQLAAGEIDAVITRDRARLSRDFDERLALISVFRETETEWHVVEHGGRLGLGDVENAGIECVHAMTDHAKKMVEIERSRDAVERRLEKGFDHGRPPFGLEFDENGEYWVPGDEFETALRVIRLRRDHDASWAAVRGETGVGKAKAKRVMERADRYLEESRDD